MSQQGVLKNQHKNNTPTISNVNLHTCLMFFIHYATAQNKNKLKNNNNHTKRTQTHTCYACAFIAFV